uniref:ATP synthase complex subunit 8 n=1 Tax=Acmaeodera sp. RUGACM01 TaxID=1205531 RepID=A0A0S2MPW2_9COLE|nr:ATP synthase F0 subunit 8 [Acmaeodera sp. RUGACM01]
MPQMAPLNWLILFIVFTLAFLTIILINYFRFLPSPSYWKSRKLEKKINWKW